MATVGRLAVVLTASATDFERAIGRAARAVKNTEREFMRSARRMEDIGRKWTIGVTAPIIAGFTAVSKAAIDWEDSFAGVRKTVDATEAQFAQLDESLRKMTERIPLSHREIANIAETAGQLGIQVENIESFTETMAMLGTATNMASDEAAEALAQMANVMQSGQKVFDRYGSTVVHLGNNLATTESNIVEFGQRIAGAGKIAGLTEAQVLSIGGAFASVGISAEAGGTAVSKVLQSMTEAVATGNKNLQGFAAVAGMSASEFAKLWRENAALAFTRFVEGLGASGDQAFVILRTLGLTDQRLTRAFLSMAGAGDLLRKSIDMGTKAWEENVALINEANERYRTGASRLRMLRNRVYNAAISFGSAFAPLLEIAIGHAEKLIGSLQRLSEWFEQLPAPIRNTAGTILLLLAAIGPTYLAMAFLHRTIAGGLALWASVQAFAGNVSFAFASWRMGAATLGEALSYLVGGPIKATILGVGALIAISLLLIANWDKVKSFAIAVWNAIGAGVIYAGSLIVRGVGLVVNVISFLVPALKGAAQNVYRLADTMKASAGSMLGSAKSALSSAKSTNAVAQAAEKGAKAQNDVANSAQNAAGAQDKLAKGINKAGKVAQNNLQGFDEVHQIQEEMSDSPAASMADFEIPKIEVPEMPDFGDVGIGGIGDVVSGLGDGLKNIAESAGEAFDTLKQKMEPVNKAVQWIKDNWPTIEPIVEGIASVILVSLLPALIKSGVEATIAGGKHVAAWVMAGAEALKQAGIMIAQLVATIAKWAWSGVQAGIHAAKMAAAWITAAGPIGWLSAAIVGLAVLIIANWEDIKEWTINTWSKISDWLVNAWNKIKQAASTIWTAIKDFFVKWWDELLAIVTGPIGILVYLIVHNWDSIKETTVNVWNGIKEWLGALWDGIVTVATTVWEALKTTISVAWTAIADFTTMVWDGIKLVLTTVWDWMVTTATTIWDGLKTAISVAWDAIKLVTETVWNAIKDFLTGLWGGITNVAITVWDGLKNVISTAWNWIKDVSETVWNTIRDFISGLWNGIKNTATTVWDGLKNIISAAWDFIKSGTETVWNTVRDFVLGVWNGIKTTASTTWNIVKETISGAVTSATQAVYNFASNVFEKIKSFGNSVLESIKGAWNKVPSAISTPINNAFNSIKGWVSNVLNKLSGLKKDAIKYVENMINGIVKWVKDLPQKTLNVIKNWGSDIVGHIKNAYMKIVGGSIVPDLVIGVTSWIQKMYTTNVTIVQNMGQELVKGFNDFAKGATKEMTNLDQSVSSVAQNISIGLQNSFSNTFNDILDGATTLSQSFQKIMTGIGDVMKKTLANQLSQAATKSLSTLSRWVLGVVSSVSAAVSAVISQAYATLVAFYAWSGPAAPALAAGTIAAALAGIGVITAQALNAFRGVVGLAKGGIVTGPTLAMMGEGGRREAVIPLERDNVIADSVGRAVYEAMITAAKVNQASGPSSEGEREVVLRIDGVKIAQAILPALIREGQRQDMQVVVRPLGG